MSPSVEETRKGTVTDARGRPRPDGFMVEQHAPGSAIAVETPARRELPSSLFTHRAPAFGVRIDTQRQTGAKK